VSTLLSVHCLAKLYSERSNVTKAGSKNACLDLFTRCIIEYEGILGEKHPLTLTAVHDMADFLSNGGEDKGAAEVLYRRALQGRQEGDYRMRLSVHSLID